ncbi:MAG: hypothetical protein K2H43_00555, partial [Clostridia bacterium]|nr:hypothetical protein [Clostridia bacterium]
LSFLVLIPLIGGIILNIVGGQLENERIVYAGSLMLSVGVPVTMFLLVVIGLILMITGRLADDKGGTKDAKTDEEANLQDAGAAEREEEKIEEVNSSYGYDSRRKNSEYLMGHVADNYKNSTLKEKISGWLFFGFLMTDFALILVFAFLRLWVGIIVCFSLFVGTILLAFIIKKILEKTSMSGNIGRLKKRKILSGTVKACLLSSETSAGGAHRYSTTRILKVIYRVKVDVAGKEYTAYSDRFYETGEIVTIAAKGKRASVIDLEQLRGELKEMLDGMNGNRKSEK